MVYKPFWSIFAVLVLSLSSSAPVKAAETIEKVTCLGFVETDGNLPFPYVPHVVGGLHHLHWIRAADDQDRKLRLDRHPGWSALCWAKISAELWEKKVKHICTTDDICQITGTVVIPEDNDANKYWKSVTKIRRQQ
jgi:hypothetical protein